MHVIPAINRLTLLGTLLVLASPLSAAAQERHNRSECRCVDADGNEIPSCTCLRTPDVEGLLARAMPWRSPRVRLGITISEDQSEQDDARGARVQSVTADSPAEEAGLEAQDVITRIDGHSLLDPLDDEVEEDFDPDRSIPVQRLLAVVHGLQPADTVEVEYLRDGKRHTATVAVRELEDWTSRVRVLSEKAWNGERLRRRMEGFRDRMKDRRWNELRFEEPRIEGNLRILTDSIGGPEMLFGRFGPAGRCPGDADTHGVVWSSGCVGGLELVNLNPELGSYFGTEHGVLVSNVTEDSTLGLKPGDVILRVGDRKATDADRVRRILRSYDDGEDIVLHIMRDQREMSVQGRLKS